MHDWPLVHRYDDLWCQWAIAQCTTESFRVVVASPSFDNNLGFPRLVEDFAVEQFVLHPSIKDFAVAVLPECSRLDSGGLCYNRLDPVPDSLGNELWARCPA